MKLFKTPKFEAPKLEPLPTESSEEVKARARQAMLEMRKRRGASSSILTDRDSGGPSPKTRTLGRSRLAA